MGDDIEIEFTGLRPGEKLYEELYSDSEHHQPTRHSKIMVADCQARRLLEVLHDIGRLSEVVNQPNDGVREALRGIIPVLESGEVALSAKTQAVRHAA